MPQLLLSPCCRGRVRKFGRRRFQCVSCFKTWRKQKKKRGRKRLKVNRQMAVNYLHQKPSRLNLSPDAIKRRRKSSLLALLANPAWQHPQLKGRLIIIVDAMWQTVANQACCVYLVLIRSVDDTKAWILPPVIVPGTESLEGWTIALENIPASFNQRILALVCDGKLPLIKLAQSYGWLVQRCHFHLLASIKNYVTSGPLSRKRLYGRVILTNVQTALYTKDEIKLNAALEDIFLLAKLTKNRLLKSRLLGFVKHIDDYRIYLKYPELNLPTTTNSAESYIQQIRDLQYRAKGFRTADSFIRWIKAICLVKKTITCNGKYQPIKRL